MSDKKAAGKNRRGGRTLLELYGNTCLTIAVTGMVITCFFAIELPFWVAVVFIGQATFFFLAGMSAFVRTRFNYYFLLTSLYLYALSFPVGTWFGLKVLSFVKSQPIREEYLSPSG